MENENNKYLEKVALNLSSMGAHAGIGAGLGGAYGYAKDKIANRKKPKSTLRTVGNVALGAATGGFLGAYVHGVKTAFKDMPPPGSGSRGGRGYYGGGGGGSGRGRAGGTFNSGSVDDHLKSFGVSRSSFKTKAEANKHMKTHMHKLHPDKPGGSTEAFQKASTSAKAIRESEWFEKLAGFENAYLEKIAFLLEE